MMAEALVEVVMVTEGTDWEVLGGEVMEAVGCSSEMQAGKLL